MTISCHYLKIIYLNYLCRCCSYIAELERQQSNHGTMDLTQRMNGDNSSPLSDSSSSISDYLNGELSPNGDQTRTNEKSNSNGGILSSADVSRAIFALSAAVDRLFEHAANTLHIEALLSFLQVTNLYLYLYLYSLCELC